MHQWEVNKIVASNLLTPKREHLLSRKWTNPFVKKLYSFSDRIFTFENVADDLQKVHRLCLGRRIVCELGSGSGRHLLACASISKEQICFGIELRYKRAVRTIEKAQEQELDNVYLLHADARKFAEIFPEQSVAELYVHFPDPWAKKRQKKHRLLQADFLNSAHKVLKHEGIIGIKTDHAEYYQSFLSVVTADPRFIIMEQTNNLHSSKFAAKDIRTEFEELFCSQAKPVHYLKLKINDEKLT